MLIRSGFVFLILILSSSTGWTCWNQYSTCTNGTSTAGQGCKSPGVTPRVCFIEVSGVGCYYIYNSTGKDLFIPTNTVSQFQSFVNSPGAGVSATAGTRGTTCFPSCYMNALGCPSPAGSAANPP